MASRRDRKTPTKKHLARLERERIQRRYILLGGLLVLLAVIGLIGYGILEQTVIQPSQPVAIVNGDKITTKEFQARVRYERRQLVQQYLRTYQTMQLFAGGSDQSTQAFFVQNLQQIELQLDPDTLGQQLLDTLIQDSLIRQEADRRGITVSSEEVDKAIQEAFGYYPSGKPPTPTPAPTTAPTSTLSPTQLALVPPTPTPAPTESITATPVVTATPSLEASPTITSTSTPTPSGTATPTPTPTPYTYEAFQQDYQSVVEALKKEINFSERQLRQVIESQLYRQKVMEALTKDLPRTQEQVWARHILVPDQETANTVETRLKQGEDFAKLAAEFSTDDATKNNGGDLGWFPVGQMDPAFEKVAFNLNIGQISDPVESQFGWHIIQVLGHEDRPLSDAQYQQLQLTKFNDWLTQQRSKENVQTFEYWHERVPTEPTIPPDVQQAASNP
ncbi:MAG TPA: peptidylprolyl isomerase [Anaerolineales bacterium]|nr:peptidylprolyl isomerase [Anaerolineales bacterium]